MKTKFIIVNVNTDKIVKKLSVDGIIEKWQKTIILNDFCEINELDFNNYRIYEIK